MFDKRKIKKNIDGFKNYQIDNFGNVYFNGKRIIPKKYKNGYLYVSLKNEMLSATASIHRLVACAFLERPNHKNIVNHIDGNKENNNLKNLEWCTHKENMAHASKENLLPKGEEKINSKLSNSDCLTVFKMYESGKSVRSIAKHFNIGASQIGNILKGKTYKSTAVEPYQNLKRLGFSRDEILGMKSLKDSGVSLREIAKRYGSSRSTVDRYIKRVSNG